MKYTAAAAAPVVMFINISYLHMLVELNECVVLLFTLVYRIVQTGERAHGVFYQSRARMAFAVCSFHSVRCNISLVATQYDELRVQYHCRTAQNVSSSVRTAKRQSLPSSRSFTGQFWRWATTYDILPLTPSDPYF